MSDDIDRDELGSWEVRTTRGVFIVEAGGYRIKSDNLLTFYVENNDDPRKETIAARFNFDNVIYLQYRNTDLVTSQQNW